MDEQKIIDRAEELVSDFLTQLGLEADTEIAFEDSEGVNYLNIKILGENLNELVGYHGQNIDAAQVLFGLILWKNFKDDDFRVILEINDYRERRKSYLASHAQRAAEQVRESGQEIELEPMKPNERRIIHITLKEEKDVMTESLGEGMDRRIVIKPVE